MSRGGFQKLFSKIFYRSTGRIDFYIFLVFGKICPLWALAFRYRLT
jgi:hypothetical protein